MKGSAVFLDTSIQIARLVHGPDTQERIEARLRQYDITVSSSVVKQEFKRRLLKEAAYLLRLFEELGSFQRVQRHVVDVLGGSPQNNRKRNICLETLATIQELSSDADRTEAAINYLEMMLEHGPGWLEDHTGTISIGADCACAKQPIKKRGRKYDFGKDRCSKTRSQCGVAQFLKSHETETKKVLAYFLGLASAEKSAEIARAESFIEKALADPIGVESLDPCSTVGDLIIALESIGIPNFYTLNFKESKHFCTVLGQRLIVRRPTRPHEDDWVVEPS